MGPIYRIYQEFLYSTKDLFYVDASPSNAPIVPSQAIRPWLEKVVAQKYRQGYMYDENGENPYLREDCSQPIQGKEDDAFNYIKNSITEVSDPAELVVTLMRVPFKGRTGDMETGDLTYTNTGMTELITLHAELTPRPYGYNPDTIPIYPINPGGK